MRQEHISEFVLKIASRCNLNCGYCYEYNLGDHSWKLQPRFMSHETISTLGDRMREHAQLHGLKDLAVGLHGGEPLLVGAERLDRYCRTLRHKMPPGVSLHIGIQTNGVLLTPEIIEVIKRHSIYVSVSIDGSRSANDRHRRYRNGRSSHDAVQRGIACLQERAPTALVGALAVIDLRNDPIDSFDALAALGVPLIDFLLPHHTWDTPPPRLGGSAVPYADWYYALFEAWIADRHGGVRIRFLENIVRQLAGASAIFEAMTLEAPSLIVVATDGSLEAVDCLKSTASGVQQTGLHLMSSSFDDALKAEILAIRHTREGQLCHTCRACPQVNSCAGGYFPHRWSTASGFANPSVYCADLFSLIARIKARLLGGQRDAA